MHTRTRRKRGVITSLLQKHTNAKIVDIDIVNNESFSKYRQFITHGITHWSGNSYDESVKKSIRIIPSPEMMGFYIAKIIKI